MKKFNRSWPFKEGTFKSGVEVVVKNTVRRHVRYKGYNTESYKPRKIDLEFLEMSLDRFMNIYNNIEQPSFDEAYRLSEWLQISIYNIIKFAPADKKKSEKKFKKHPVYLEHVDDLDDLSIDDELDQLLKN